MHLGIIDTLLDIATYFTKYIHKDALLYRLNPLTKLTFAVAVVISGMFLSTTTTGKVVFPWTYSLYLFLGVLVIAIIGRVPLVEALKRNWPMVVFFVCTISVLNLFFQNVGLWYATQQHVIYQWGWATLTEESLAFGLGRAFLFLTILLLIIIVLKTTRLSDMAYSLYKVGLPYVVAMIFTTAIRCVSVVTGAFTTVYDAQRARGFDLQKGGLVDRLRHLKNLVIPLLVVIIKTADVMTLVYESRGLDLEKRNRTRLIEVPMRGVDYAIMVASAVFCAVIVIVGLMRGLYWFSV